MSEQQNPVRPFVSKSFSVIKSINLHQITQMSYKIEPPNSIKEKIMKKVNRSSFIRGRLNKWMKTISKRRSSSKMGPKNSNINFKPAEKEAKPNPRGPTIPMNLKHKRWSIALTPSSSGIFSSKFRSTGSISSRNMRRNRTNSNQKAPKGFDSDFRSFEYDFRTKNIHEKMTPALRKRREWLSIEKKQHEVDQKKEKIYEKVEIRRTRYLRNLLSKSFLSLRPFKFDGQKDLEY